MKSNFNLSVKLKIGVYFYTIHNIWFTRLQEENNEKLETEKQLLVEEQENLNKQITQIMSEMEKLKTLIGMYSFSFVFIDLFSLQESCIQLVMYWLQYGKRNISWCYIGKY